jgi:hypothetical protein
LTVLNQFFKRVEAVFLYPEGFIYNGKNNELVKSQKRDGNVKSSSSRRREFRGMRRTYVRRSEHGMKRKAEIGLFTLPSKINRKN